MKHTQNAWCKFVGLAGTIKIRCVYSIFGKEITKNTVIHDSSGQPYKFSAHATTVVRAPVGRSSEQMLALCYNV
jgi:uncharacterized protein YjhX (UPF0386 family)